MLIELPEWTGLRIEGDDGEWQVQRKYEKGKNAGSWYTTNFFPSIEHAIGFAYEKSLRKSAKKAETIESAMGECRRVKDELIKAVRKAVA